jgi:hypothetical protein
MLRFARNRSEGLESDVKALRRDVSLLVKRVRSNSLPELQDRLLAARRLSKAALTSALEDTAPDGGELDEARKETKKCKTCLNALGLQTSQELDVADAARNAILHPQFPCLVLSVNDLRKFDRIPSFEQVANLGLLRLVTVNTFSPDPGRCAFISHVSRLSVRVDRVCKPSVRRSGRLKATAKRPSRTPITTETPR